MTKQAELKKQAYESDLKSRALSVLIYLIDRSNKELTCFPAISTMAKQLHISVSTVKRAIRELDEAGYIERSLRFRENQGQSSNLYTLILKTKEQKDNTGTKGGKHNAGDCRKNQIEFISFEGLTKGSKKTEESRLLIEADPMDNMFVRSGFNLTLAFRPHHSNYLWPFIWMGEEVNLIPP